MKVFYLFSFFVVIVIIKKHSLGTLKQGTKINLNDYLTQFEIGSIKGLILNIEVSLQLLTSYSLSLGEQISWFLRATVNQDAMS